MASLLVLHGSDKAPIYLLTNKYRPMHDHRYELLMIVC